ncbi:aldehyde dehydrogenase family protein [Undibacterium arcticum]|uniref:Aldehyde dehydrogenase family protein n=1 Tax=Undibacterium arcticum TaxID=1762892 RepID=A0ABV7F180_9BURK
MTQTTQFYINGAWVKPSQQSQIDVVNSHTEQVIARIPEATVQEAEQAIAAARAAFDAWSQTPPEVRADYLQKIADGLKARSEELAQTISDEVGIPLRVSGRLQVSGPIWQWGNYAKIIQSFEWQQQVGNSLVVREPIGVVACITPWNFPFSQITLKVAAALAAGCTVVLKPSEVAPINAFILAEVIHAAGLPAGVFNMITGYGPVVGEVLASHPDVDMVSFTGSTRAGKRVAELAAASVKRVALELGGKSASVILDDADFEKAIKGTVGACFLNSGQTCSAHTRMLVPHSRVEEAKALAKRFADGYTVGDPRAESTRLRVEEAKALAKRFADGYTVGDPRAESTRLGPLVSAVQRDRVVSLIEKGIENGMELVTGGPGAPLPTGFYVKPTVFATNDSKAVLAQEEIFGPVLTIIPYQDEDDAIRIANDSIYGLGGAVWSGDEDRAVRVARRIRTGQVDINGGAFNPLAPFGGYKQSGVGRENGCYGLEEYLQFKALQMTSAAA